MFLFKEKGFLKLLFSFVIGVGLLLVSLIYFVLETNSIKKHPESLGKITSKYEIPKKNDYVKEKAPLYWVQYDYIKIEGDIVDSGQVPVDYEVWRKYKEGDTIIVIYDPENNGTSAPKESYVENLNHYKTGLIISLIIFCLSVINFGVFLRKHLGVKAFKSA